MGDVQQTVCVMTKQRADDIIGIGVGELYPFDVRDEQQKAAAATLTTNELCPADALGKRHTSDVLGDQQAVDVIRIGVGELLPSDVHDERREADIVAYNTNELCPADALGKQHTSDVLGDQQAVDVIRIGVGELLPSDVHDERRRADVITHHANELCPVFVLGEKRTPDVVAVSELPVSNAYDDQQIFEARAQTTYDVVSSLSEMQTTEIPIEQLVATVDMQLASLVTAVGDDGHQNCYVFDSVLPVSFSQVVSVLRGFEVDGNMTDNFKSVSVLESCMNKTEMDGPEVVSAEEAYDVYLIPSNSGPPNGDMSDGRQVAWNDGTGVDRCETVESVNGIHQTVLIDEQLFDCELSGRNQNALAEKCQVESSGNSVSLGYNTLGSKTSFRKRRREPDNWVRNKRRMLRNSGRDYVNSRGKLVLGKKFGGLPQNCCKRGCCKTLSSEECAELFEKHWNTANYDVQSSFIAGCVSQRQVACHRVPHSDVVNAGKAKNNRHDFHKTFARRYTLPFADRFVQVCKTVFCAVLGVSSSRVNTVLRKQRQNGGVPALDGRGKHDHSKQRISRGSLAFVESHIASFPVNESHYTRAHSQHRRYLNSALSVQKMYDLYVEKCGESGVQPVKRWAYRRVFDTKFNLSFHPPRKDTCKKCDIFKAQQCSQLGTAQLQTSRAEHELHLRKAESVRASLNLEKVKCSLLQDCESFTFDLQKVMSLPKLTTNEVYYCRQLSVFNLGIHSLSNDDGIMHVWDESIASRGAAEIASCLFKYCSEKADIGVRVINAYSDACGGQNRNYKIVLMWMHLCKSTEITEINHRFMVSGHSYLPNDADFGIIERASRKTTNMYVPEHWSRLIETCNRKKPFRVVRMQPDMFKSLDELSQAVAIRKTSETGEKVEWLKIQWIQVRKSEPMKMYYKYSVQEDVDFQCVNFGKKSRNENMQYTLKQLYPHHPRPLSAEKVKDLHKLLKYVPPLYHDCYTWLQANTVSNVTHMCDDELLGQSEDEQEQATETSQLTSSAASSRKRRGGVKSRQLS